MKVMSEMKLLTKKGQVKIRKIEGIKLMKLNEDTILGDKPKPPIFLSASMKRDEIN